MILETSGADSSVLTEAATEISAAMRFGPSEQQVVVLAESSAYAVRQREVAWDARPLQHRRAAETEFLKDRAGSMK